MIPESAAATPYGIFVLADDYLAAADVAHRAPQIGPGPVRLLCFHAAELFLKTYMRSAGATVATLRGMGHDLLLMVEQSASFGLNLPPDIAEQARALSDKKDYVRARYMVVDVPGDMAEEGALSFCRAIRTAVVEALNMDDAGVPKGNEWLGELPCDHPARRSQ